MNMQTIQHLKKPKTICLLQSYSIGSIY